MEGEAKKRKVLIPVFYRGHYGRLRPVFKAIVAHPRLKLVTVTAQQAAYGHFWENIQHSEPRSWGKAIPWYIQARARGFFEKIMRGKNFSNDYVAKKMHADGFPGDEKVSFMLDGGTPTVMAKSVGLGITRMVELLNKHKPDFVFINADRFEMMAVTIAAAYLNIPIVHNEAGDISGTIDESVRHAITKFAHVHLAATDASRERILQMGENPKFAFTVGSPAIDVLASMDLTPKEKFGNIDMAKPYLLVLHHPVTTAATDGNLGAVHEIVKVLEKKRMPTAIIGANSDAGSNVAGPTLQAWFEEKKPSYAHFVKSVHPDTFYRLLANASCAVGNSSSFLREGAFLGTPAVLVGNRQNNRDRGRNVLEVEERAEAIEAGIDRQLAHGRYKSDVQFGSGSTGERIAEILATVSPPIQKSFHSYSPKKA